MSLNPVTQYADDANLRARQRLWAHQTPKFDLAGWVLDLAGVAPGQDVLDVGCGNGAYLAELRRRGVRAVGCDLSPGMLRAARPHPALVNADVEHLPLADGAFDVVLAPHMLYHVPDRATAARELRRVSRPGGVCVVVTNGGGHMLALRRLVEAAARQATPGWEMANPSTHVFSLENGAAQLGVAFESVALVRTEGVAPVRLDDAAVAADYLASVADHYQDGVDRPWSEVVADVRREVQAVIDADGAFTVRADTGAFVCR
ncbi:MAG TPA: class I SAM-dependent methyltransferase [Acidimicrobiales bacterium]